MTWETFPCGVTKATVEYFTAIPHAIFFDAATAVRVSYG